MVVGALLLFYASWVITSALEYKERREAIKKGLKEIPTRPPKPTKPKGPARELMSEAWGAGFERAAHRMRRWAERHRELDARLDPKKNEAWLEKKLNNDGKWKRRMAKVGAKMSGAVDKALDWHGSKSKRDMPPRIEKHDDPPRVKPSEQKPEGTPSSGEPAATPPEQEDLAALEERIDQVLDEVAEDEAWDRNKETQKAQTGDDLAAIEARIEAAATEERLRAEQEAEDYAWDQKEKYDRADAGLREAVKNLADGLQAQAEERARQDAANEAADDDVNDVWREAMRAGAQRDQEQRRAEEAWRRAQQPTPDEDSEGPGVVRATAVREDRETGDGEPIQLEAGREEPGTELVPVDGEATPSHAGDETKEPRPVTTTSTKRGESMQFDQGAHELLQLAKEIEDWREDFAAFLTEFAPNIRPGFEGLFRDPVQGADAALREAAQTYTNIAEQMMHKGGIVRDSLEIAPFMTRRLALQGAK